MCVSGCMCVLIGFSGCSISPIDSQQFPSRYLCQYLRTANFGCVSIREKENIYTKVCVYHVCVCVWWGVNVCVCVHTVCMLLICLNWHFVVDKNRAKSLHKITFAICTRNLIDTAEPWVPELPFASSMAMTATANFDLMPIIEECRGRY